MDLELRAVNYNLEMIQAKLGSLGKKLQAVENNTREGIKKMTWFKKRKNPVDVYVRVSVVTVGDIDTVKQQFVCEFYLSLRWEEPNLQDMIGKEEEIDWREQWEPGIYFVDLVDVEKYERNETLCPPRLVNKYIFITVTTVYYKSEVKQNISESLALRFWEFTSRVKNIQKNQAPPPTLSPAHKNKAQGKE